VKFVWVSALCGLFDKKRQSPQNRWLYGVHIKLYYFHVGAALNLISFRSLQFVRHGSKKFDCTRSRSVWIIPGARGTKCKTARPPWGRGISVASSYLNLCLLICSPTRFALLIIVNLYLSRVNKVEASFCSARARARVRWFVLFPGAGTCPTSADELLIRQPLLQLASSTRSGTQQTSPFHKPTYDSQQKVAAWALRNFILPREQGVMGLEVLCRQIFLARV